MWGLLTTVSLIPARKASATVDCSQPQPRKGGAPWASGWEVGEDEKGLSSQFASGNSQSHFPPHSPPIHTVCWREAGDSFNSGKIEAYEMLGPHRMCVCLRQVSDKLLIYTHPFSHLSTHPLICLFIYSTHPTTSFIQPLISPPIRPSIHHTPTHLSIHLPSTHHPPTNPSINPTIHASIIHPPTHPSIQLFIHP